jgi:hypothetical protein
MYNSKYDCSVVWNGYEAHQIRTWLKEGILCDHTKQPQTYSHKQNSAKTEGPQYKPVQPKYKLSPQNISLHFSSIP